jgi:uncharacterized membrane protein YhiD involved in acid resistance
MKSVEEFLNAERIATIYGPGEILSNIALALVLGLVISYIYKTTHQGLSYSQSFMLTLVFVSIIVAVVMMIIGNNLARAFALVGALSIIRFRTVVKDTKDMAYVFMTLAAGMAAGTSSYFLAVTSVIFMGVVALVLHASNYGSLYKSEFILRFRTIVSDDPPYIPIIQQFTKSSNLLHVEPSGDGETSKLTFDIVMQRDADAQAFSTRISALPEVSEVVLVASKNDADY